MEDGWTDGRRGGLIDGWMDEKGGCVYECVESGQADMGRREEKKVHTVVSFIRLCTVSLVTQSYQVSSQCM